MSETSGIPTMSLRGRRALVVEDEYMIACELEEVLQRAGAETLGPVPDVQDALALIDREALIDIALLDVNLRSDPIWPVVDALRARNVPILLSTGYDESAIPGAYAEIPRLEKPVSGQELSRTLHRFLAAHDARVA